MAAYTSSADVDARLNAGYTSRMRRSLLLAALLASCRHAPAPGPSAAPNAPQPRAAVPRALAPRPAAPEAPKARAAAAPATPARVERMLRPRANHGAIRLADGRVFVIGGQSGYGSGVLDSTEFFDPATGRWSPGPSLHTPRYDFKLVPLRDGRLLVAGGRGADKSELSEAEIYEPSSGRWTRTGALAQGRSNADAVALPDGRVLIAGGHQSGRSLRTTEIYDPDSGVWTPGPAMRHARQASFLAALRDGRVLAAGGGQVVDTFLAEAELLDAGAARWSPTDPLPSPRGYHLFFTLADGRVLVAGGVVDPTNRVPDDSAIFDPASGTWSRVAPALPATLGYAAWLGGKPAIVGGHQGGAALRLLQVYEEKTGSWRPLAPLAHPRLYSSLTTLSDGRLLIAGGENGPRAVAAVELRERDGSLSAASEPAAEDPAPAAPTARAAAPVERPRPTALARRPERPGDYALVVGVERYKSLPAASFASNDARSAADAFQALGVPEENLVLLDGSRAGLADLSKYVEEWLPKRVTADSRVYFFFSGHGAPDVDGGAPYLMPWDADAAFVKSTGFALARLYGALEKLPAKEVIVALDSCFSGSGGRSVLAPGLRPLVNLKMPPPPRRRLSILAASEAAEAAGGLPAVGHGAFTYHLLEGLGGAADKDGDGRLTLAEWHGYARKRVILDARAQNREQTPTLATATPSLRLY